MQETVEFYLNKPKFGIENYKPRDATLNLAEPRAFKQQKFKRETFVTSIPKLTQIVPAPSHYNLTIDWSKHRPSHN